MNDELLAVDALQNFLKEFGPMDDPYNRLVLEILMEELFLGNIDCNSPLFIEEKNENI